jgi:hypothetical protein
MSFLNDMRFEAKAVLNASVSQKDNDILNQRVAELEEKTRVLEKQLNQQQLDAATRESELQAQVEKLSRMWMTPGKRSFGRMTRGK